MTTTRAYRNNTRKPKKPTPKKPGKSATPRKRARKSVQLRQLATLRNQVESGRDRLGAAALVLLDALDVTIAARRKAAEAIELARDVEVAAEKIGLVSQ